jgi:O-antigen ligase
MFSFKEFISSRAMMVSTLIFLFPLCINTLRHWVSSIFILIFLFSISAVKKYKWDLKKEEKIFLLILLLHVLTVLVSNLLAGWTYASHRWFFAGEIRLLLAIPIYLYLRQIPDIWKWILRGIPLGAVIIGLTGIIDFSMRYSTGDISMIFAEGAYGHIFQGNIAALLSIFRTGAVLALTGAVLSVTRNAWLSLVLLYFVAFLLKGGVSKYSSAFSFKRFVVILVVFIPALYFLSGIDYVKARFERVVEEPVAYFNADRSKPIPFTSIGFRLEQWRGVLLAFEEKPLLGHGVGNMGKVTNVLIREGKINEVVYLEHTEKTGRPTHVHSAYFEFLGDTGLIGLTFTLLMLGYPMYVAVKKRQRNNHAWKFVFIHSFAFAIASLTEVPFIRNNWTSVFLVFGLVFFVWLIQESDATPDSAA